MSIVSLYTGASALAAHQQFMSVVANNLANVNTVGYKGSRALFEDALSQTIRPPTAAGTTPGDNGAQIGLGTRMSSITPYFSQGSIQVTGLPSDVAIEGNGFFAVRDPVTNANYYTRAGAFGLDSNGFMVNSAGLRVQGGAAGAVSGAALQDMQVPNNIAGVPVVSYSIDVAGRINVLLEDGTSANVGQITLENFSNPQALQKMGDNLYTSNQAAGQIFNAYQTPGQGGTGALRSGYLELSNVDLGQEFSDMIRGQRGLQANARVITTADEILQELINLKR